MLDGALRASVGGKYPLSPSVPELCADDPDDVRDVEVVDDAELAV